MGSAKKEFLNKTKIEFYNEIKKYQSQLKPTKEIDGFGNSSIVGEKNYPNLKIHNVSTQEKENSFFNTGDIVKQDYSQIIKLKAKNILGSTQETYIKKSNDRINKELVDIYKSKKAVEFNSSFEKELSFNKVLVSKVSGIVGSKNPLLSLKSNENTSTSKQVEKYTENDIKAKEAIISLYEKGVNEHQITNLLSLGTFGLSFNRKLVPTKWAISAYDQTIEKHLHKKIINNRIIEKYEAYHYKDKGNDFVIILLPNFFSGEVIESFPGAVERDYIGFDNKLHKKEPETAGGFYATKISIFEQLNSRKKQAAFISIRLISDYDIPLGVVFVRECVREALKKPIFTTSDHIELIKFLNSKFTNHRKFFESSKVYLERNRQKRIGDFF